METVLSTCSTSVHGDTQEMPMDLSIKKKVKVEYQEEDPEDNNYKNYPISETSPIDLSLSPKKHKRKSTDPRKLTDFSVKRFFTDSPGSSSSGDSRDAIVSHSIVDLSTNYHGSINSSKSASYRPLIVDTSIDQYPVSMVTGCKQLHGNHNQSNHLLVIPSKTNRDDGNKAKRRDSTGSAGSSADSYSDDVARLPSHTVAQSMVYVPPTVAVPSTGLPGVPYFPYPGSYYPYPVAPSLMPILYPNLWKLPQSSRGPYRTGIANVSQRNPEQPSCDPKTQPKRASDKNNNVQNVNHATSETLSDDEADDMDLYSGRQRKNYKNMTRERRVEANARERTRVHTISAAFEELRKAVPSYYHNQKLSKLAILRIACCYIMALARLLGEDYSKDGNGMSFEECMELCNQTILADNKARKRH